MGARVLVVEDNEILRSAYIAKLTMEGYSVESAVDGEEALAKARAWSPDLILLDIHMPRKTGLEFLQEYDLKGEHPNVKVIVFSNWSVPDVMRQAIDLGAHRFFIKSSVTPKALVGLIREVLAG